MVPDNGIEKKLITHPKKKNFFRRINANEINKQSNYLKSLRYANMKVTAATFPFKLCMETVSFANYHGNCFLANSDTGDQMHLMTIDRKDETFLAVTSLIMTPSL